MGLASWVRSLAEEFGPSGVRVNPVAPGATLTGRMRQSWTPKACEDMAKPTVLGRLGRVEEIGATIAFLASPESGNITGQSIRGDGGAAIRDPAYGGERNQGVEDIRQNQLKRLASGKNWP